MTPQAESNIRTNAATMCRTILHAALTHSGAIWAARNHTADTATALAATIPTALATSQHVAAFMEEVVTRPQSYEANPDPSNPNASRIIYDVRRGWMAAMAFPGVDVGVVDITDHLREYERGVGKLSARSMRRIAEMPTDRMCCPLLAIKEGDGVRIIDGNHRAVRHQQEGLHLAPVVVLPEIVSLAIRMTEREAIEYAREAIRTNTSVRDDEIDKLREACNVSLEMATRLVAVTGEPVSEETRVKFVSLLAEAGLTPEQFGEAMERA